MHISQSDIVRVRRARWRIVDVCAYERCQVLMLVGISATNDGLERRILAPFEVVERIERRSRPARIPRRLWRRACRALIAAETPPGALRRAGGARIDLLPHQLEPALAVIRGLGSRVLLADDVGLGKTIQAGLIVSELRARGAAERVLIITPAGLRDQWASELSARFGIEATILDVRTLRRSIRALPVGVNPWQTVPVAIASIDYVKRVEVLAAVGACWWDAIVVDEAHGVAGNSDRQAAVAALTARSPYVILLTATPHSGDRRTFASLCGLGAPIGESSAEPLLVFRRSRLDVRLVAPRRVHRLHVRMSGDETRMHALLARFSRAIRRQHETGTPETNDYWLALSVLHKRALSSARSLQRSVDRRLAMLGSAEEPSASQLDLPLGDPDGELTTADEPPVWSPLLHLKNAVHERHLLGALATAAGRAARQETKIAALGRLLRRVNEPVIVFTEYRDTLLHVQTSLGLAAVALHGGMARDERLAVIDQFTRGTSRLLLATDAAGEGLNLQRGCRLIVNLELPWNPIRLEQRIGRVDRIGQRRTVHVFHLIAGNSGESQVLSRLQSRIARARAEIGGADPLGTPLGSGNESAIARLVITGDRPGTPCDERVDAAQPAERLWTPPLAGEAQAEAARIARARPFMRAGDERALVRIEARGPSLTSARHWRTRAVLGGRAVMLWQIAAEDGTGRLVASTVVAVALDDWLHYDLDAVQKRVGQAAAAWRERTTSHHHAFIAARLAREHAGDLSPGSREAFQPGLFERRSQRARHAIIAADRTADLDRADRILALERARTVVFLPPQFLLVLTP